MKQYYIKDDDSQASKLGKSFMCGISAGGFSAAISTPFDVIKTRIQAGVPGGVIGVFSSTVRNEGYKALVKGLGPRIVAIGPLFGIAIMMYDVQKRFIRSLGYDC